MLTDNTQSLDVTVIEIIETNQTSDSISLLHAISFKNLVGLFWSRHTTR